MFLKEQRITKKEEFDLIYKKGLVFNLEQVRFFVLKNNLNRVRVSVVVSKKISPLATKRNKIKRILRQLLRKNLKKLPENIDLIIMPQNITILNLKNSEIETDFLNLSKKLKNRT